MQFYTDPEREKDPNALPNAEVFEWEVPSSATAEALLRYETLQNDDDDEPLEPGFYWWACMPGCLPDSDPQGPFESEQEAIDDAQNERNH